jgi:hypothetical protein
VDCMHLAGLRALLRFAAIGLLLPGTAAAQDWSMPWSDPRDRPPRVDFNASAGLLVPTDWSDLVLLGSVSPASGVQEQVLVRDLRVEPGTVFSAAVTYWKSKYGFRVHAARSESSLLIGDEPGSIDLDTWLYDVRGAIGLIEYTPGRWVWPYAFFGFGGITYDLERTITPPLLTFIERGPIRSPGREDIVIVEDSGRQFLLAVDELGLETVFAFNFGVGTDLRIPFGPAGVGVRLEVSDHIAPSPLNLQIHELSSFGVPPSRTAVRFGAVHHLRAAVGLVLQVGR